MKLETIEKSQYYHIYNRGINSVNIFNNEENKCYFLQLYGKYIAPHTEVFGYCLMDTHFHFLLKIVSGREITTKAFSNFFNAYAKAFNKSTGRTGSLFEKHFKRKKITDENYLKNLLIYIHKNPKEIHNYGTYKFSSFHHYLEFTQPQYFKLSKEYVVNTLFDSAENMVYVHKKEIEFSHSVLGEEDLQSSLRQHLAGNDNTEFDLQGFQNLVGLNTNIPMKELFIQYIRNLQNKITFALEEIDGKAKFKEDKWTREDASAPLSTGGGGGQTRVIENGNVFEKGGVNTSEVFGKLPESMQQYFGVKDADFFACGLSLVLHPVNPFVPTVHANWRYFEMYDAEGNIVDQWFGGGQDLTPYYLFEEDAKHFHQVCKTVCDKHNPEFYETYKKRCDEYFYNTHRKEGRGIGGLFFDYLKETETMKMQDWYNFVTEVGDSFLDSYLPIVEKRKDITYSEENKNWQEIRRGRYVEFNLVHDKGTLFGLKTKGRIESILMSLPPVVQWKYDHHPEKGSEEEKLVEVLRKPKNWINN